MTDPQFPNDSFDNVFLASLRESHENLDVAYYTRKLGDSGVFYHGIQGKVRLNDENGNYSYDALGEMNMRIESIGSEEGYKSAREAIDRFVS